MKKNIIITVIITIFIAIAIMVYGFILLTNTWALGNKLGIIFLLVVVAVTAGFLYIVVHNMNERIKEIKEEDKDDLSKY